MKRVILPYLFAVALFYLGSINLPQVPGADVAISTIVLMVMSLWCVQTTYVTEEGQRWTRFELNRYLLPVFGFFVIGLVSLVGSLRYFGVEMVLRGILYLGNFCLYLAAPAVIAEHIQSRDQARTLIGATFFLGFPMLLALLVMVVTEYRFHHHTIAIAGLEPLDWYWDQSQLALGMFLATLTSVAAALLLGTDLRYYQTAALTVIATLGSFLTLATLSRSSFLALGVGLGVVVLAFQRRLVLAAPAVLFLFPDFLTIRLRRTLSPTYVTELGMKIPISMSERTVKWIKQLQIFADNPLFGTGFALERFRAVQVYGYRMAPDNQYIGLLTGTGILGLLAFGYWFLFNVRVLVNVDETEFKRAFAVGVLGALLGFVCWGLFQGFYARTRVLGILALYLGVAWYYYLESNRSDTLSSDAIEPSTPGLLDVPRDPETRSSGQNAPDTQTSRTLKPER